MPKIIDHSSSSRRKFMKNAAGAGLMAPLIMSGCDAPEKSTNDDKLETRLLEAMNSPVLKKALFPDPVMIESVELLNLEDQYFVRVRSTDGAEGIAMTNRQQIRYVYPMFIRMVAPRFVQKDARNLDTLVEAAFRYKQNYKWQGLGFWSCVSWMEFAILDLLGNVSGRSLGELLGNRIRSSSKIYYANGDRTSKAPEVVDQLEKLIEISGAKAIKHKVGGRMKYSKETTARDKALIPLVRKRLGDDTNIFTDANSSFDVPMALEIGRILQEHNYGFFEEPVRFDDFDGTREVAEQLNLPIAGGEEEYSIIRFKSLIRQNVLQVVQPDILFFGGFIRSIRVARMAEAAGKKVVPHMSGFGLGILHVLHFASIVPNAFDYQEFKGDKDGVPYLVTGTDKPLQSIDGEMAIPNGPGLGVTFDPDYFNRLKPVIL